MYGANEGSYDAYCKEVSVEYLTQEEKDKVVLCKECKFYIYPGMIGYSVNWYYCSFEGYKRKGEINYTTGKIIYRDNKWPRADQCNLDGKCSHFQMKEEMVLYKRILEWFTRCKSIKSLFVEE